SSHIINIQEKYANQENLKRVWAPQTIFDEKAQKYMVYWSMQHSDGPDIIYYAYVNADFSDLEGEPKPLFIPKNKQPCIDGDIIYKNGIYHLFYKTDRKSTRLNSSHVKISYAVFCLKKKKQLTNIRSKSTRYYTTPSRI